MLNFLKRPSAKNVSFIALGILFVYLLSVRPISPFQTLKLKIEDLFFLNSHLLKEKPPELEAIVLIALDDASFTKVNRRWPWDRAIYADLTEKISRQKPKLILLDVAFVGESESPESDALLASSIEKGENVILPYHIGEDGKAGFPLEKVRQATLDIGPINKPLDIDFTIRQAQALHWTKDGKILDFAFELKAAGHLFGGDPFHSKEKSQLLFQRHETQREGRFRGSEIPIPIRRDGTLFLNYQARVNDFKIIPVWKVLLDEIPPDTLKNKIVLFGITNRLMHDIHNTPFGPLPGVLIVANFLLMILSGSYITEAGVWVNLLMILLAGLVTSYATFRLSLWRGFLFLFYEVAILLGVTFFLYTRNIHWDFVSALFSAILCYLGITFYKYLALLIENVRLKEEAITDGLTGLYAYRYFDLRLRNEFDRSQRYHTPLSLIFIDIDHFKRINDTYGHEEGNVVLKTIAQILKKNTRRVDLTARYGGEEFCVVLPQTDLEGARQHAETLRKIVEQTSIPISPNQPLNVTVSIGVSSYPRSPLTSSDQLVKLTDSALYKAKQTGRNRVCVA